jgi:type IV pilus assembly protein PilW
MKGKTFIRHREKKQKGITLVELMIAMVIGLLLTAGILQLFVSNKQTYRVTENMSRLQENGRFAMHFLTSDIRMADYWGCRSQGLAIDNNLNPDPNFNLPIAGLAGSNDDTAVNSIINGTDTITVKGVFSSNNFLVSIPANLSADLKVTDNSGLNKNDLILISDCSDGDILQITNDPSTGASGQDNVVHNTGAVASGPGNAEKPLKKLYGTDAQVYKLNFATYSIRSGTNGQNALFRSINGAAAQELVEGIEDMQVLYGEDTDSDGAANYYKPSDSAGLNMDDVVSVRISLVVVTLDDNVTEQANPYTLFGGAAITPTDRRIRRVFTSTIVIRNRLS